MTPKDEILGCLYSVLTFLDNRQEILLNSARCDDDDLDMLVSLKDEVSEAIELLEGSTL